jgi:hypothetical protein
MTKKQFWVEMASMGYHRGCGTMVAYEAAKRKITKNNVLSPKQYEKYIRWIAAYLGI